MTAVTATQVIVIGGSAGSLDVILKVLPDIRLNKHTAIIIVLHRKSSDDSPLVELLSYKTTLSVKEAEEKDLICGQCIYVAPSDYHLLIERDHTFSVDFSEKVNYSRPSIDITFQVVAEIYGKNTTAILLSGANADGTAGLQEVRRYQGKTVIQDPRTAEVSYMPQYALNNLTPDEILADDQIADYINRQQQA